MTPANETTGETTMITTLVQFQLPSPITLEEAARRFESSAPKYQNLPGLVRKYYVVSDDRRAAGGVYLWESRAAAEKVYSGEWRERVTKLYGSAPAITWFETPVIVDNAAGGTIAIDPAQSAQPTAA
jgi:putative monooxygenase ydhR